MVAVLLALCVLAARYIAYPYLCGFFGAAWQDVRPLWIRARFLWRTRAMRWKAWRSPKSTDPWTPEECATLARAMAEAIGIDEVHVEDRRSRG